MFWALLATAVVGLGIKTAGRIIENRAEQERLDVEKRLAQQQAALYTQEALFAEKSAEEVAAMQRERAELTQRETARAGSQLLEQGTAGLATQTAGTAAGGFEEGKSFEAVRQRFEKGFATELAGLMERGQVQSGQLLRQAALTEEVGGLQAQRLRYQAGAAEAQIGLIENQQQWAPWQLWLGIAGDVLGGGMTVATGALELKSLGLL